MCPRQHCYVHYEFLVISFGLTIAPTTFMSLMNSVFKIFLYSFVMVLIEDILVYSRVGKSMSTIFIVLDVLWKQRLYAKFSRCGFWLTYDAFLGNVVSKEGVMVDYQKIEAVKNRVLPNSISEVRSFVGLATYHHRFVKNFGPISTLLINWTKTRDTI